MKSIYLFASALLMLALCGCPSGANDGVTKIKIEDGAGSVTLEKKASETVTVEFDSKGYKSLDGFLISPDPEANIRFVQIITPDGEADGPFSSEIEYPLATEGRYKLIIGENMMAGDPWGGEFTVTLKLAK